MAPNTYELPWELSLNIEKKSRILRGSSLNFCRYPLGMAFIKRRNLSRFLLCSSSWILFLCIHLSFTAQTTEARYVEDWEGYHAGTSRELLSRYTVDGTTTNDRFCAADENGKCDWTAYGMALAAIGLPMLVLCVLSLLGLPCFLIFRCCCNLYGGRQPNSGMFCPNPTSTFSGYTAKDVWITKILVILFAVGICICAIFGFLANTKVRDGVHHTGDVLLDTAQFVIDQCNKMVDLLSNLPYTEDATDPLQNAIDEANSILDQAKDVRDEVNYVDGVRGAIMIASFVFPLALVLAVTLGGLLNVGMLAMLVGIFCFLASSLMWLSGSIHYVVGTALDDLCVEIDKVNNGGDRDGVLDEILPCGEFEEIYNITQSAMEEVVTYACNSTDILCGYGATVITCPPVACDQDTLPQYMNSTLNDYVIGCGSECPYTGSSCGSPYICAQTVRTVRECATQCNNTDLQSVCSDIVLGADSYDQFVSILEDFIYPLLNCTFVNDAFKKLEHSMCDEFSYGVLQIGKASVSLACLLVPATVLSIMGYKRFNSRNREDPSDLTNYELP